MLPEPTTRHIDLDSRLSSNDNNYKDIFVVNVVEKINNKRKMILRIHSYILKCNNNYILKSNRLLIREFSSNVNVKNESLWVND